MLPDPAPGWTQDSVSKPGPDSESQVRPRFPTSSPPSADRESTDEGDSTKKSQGCLKVGVSPVLTGRPSPALPLLRSVQGAEGGKVFSAD